MRNACPICGREMHVPQHRHGQRWSLHTITWVREIHAAGLSVKAIARLMSMRPGALASKLYDKRERRGYQTIRPRAANGTYKHRETTAS